ncbi:MAG: hypothetical protein LBJ35_02855 [Spirochaetaceae bacterium]|nr:hypothetical protein [Spirochaetaceae bacterium]
MSAVSCAAPPPQQPPVEDIPPEIHESVEILPPVVEVEQKAVIFDLDAITPEVYKETKGDVANFINQLNVIIKSQNYNEWLMYLDEEYYDYISSLAYLQRISASGILQAKGIVLSNAYDYFMNVVVPSRSNDRVDDIEFVSDNRVKAITLNKGRRLLLYDLEKTQNGWKIVAPQF